MDALSAPEALCNVEIYAWFRALRCLRSTGRRSRQNGYMGHIGSTMRLDRQVGLGRKRRDPSARNNQSAGFRMTILIGSSQDKDAGFPSFVRAGRMTILIGSSASLLTLFGGRSNYRNAVDAKRVAAWRCIAQRRIELGEIIGGAA